MTEIDLNAIMNLFAIQSAQVSPAERGSMRAAVAAYLAYVPGMGNAEPYLELYDEMLETQISMEVEDPAAAARGVASRLRSRLPQLEQLAVFAAFAELDESLIATGSGAGLEGAVADAFGIDAALRANIKRLCADPFGGDPLGENFLVLSKALEDESQGKACHVLVRNDFSGKFAILKIPEIECLFIKVSEDGQVAADGRILVPGAVHRLPPGSILADNHGVRIYPAELAAAFSADAEALAHLHFEGRHLDFRYKGSDDIGLHDFSFSLRGGNLVAIMGGSGAGKSTLLSILTGKLTPRSGSMWINGAEWGLGNRGSEGMIGYVPQDDLLFEDLTVFQNLYYNARLCLADLDDAEIRSRCEKILKELNQFDTAGLKVGTPLDKTISGGQRKRLNIALELIREPPVLFLDEPTSGLSSADSENVIGLLKAQAAKGRIVVATIHQPSSTVYRMFDRLWVLDKGGRPIYDGNPMDALVHFRTQGYRTDTEEYSCPHCGAVHPEQLFEIIEEKKVDEKGNPTKERKVAPTEWHLRYLKDREAQERLAEAGSSPQGAAERSDMGGKSHLRRPSALGQFAVFFSRTMKTRLANSSYLLINLLEPPVLALLAGVLFHGAWGSAYIFRDNKNLPGYFFMSMVISVFLGLSVASDEIHRDLKILERERLLNLSWGSYIASKASWLAIVAAYQMGIYTAIGNAILRIPDMGFLMWGILASASFCAAMLGLIVSSTMKSAVAIYILIPILLVPQIMLGGPTISYDELIGREAGNRNVPAVAELMPTRWGFEALMVSEYRLNRFQRNFFEDDRVVRRMDFIRDVQLPEIRGLASKLFSDPDPEESPKARETRLTKELATLGNELAFLERFSGLPAPAIKDKLTIAAYTREEQQQVTSYLKEVEAFIKPLRKAASERRDATEDGMRVKFGNAGFDMLEDRYSNKEVEKQVLDLNLGDRDSIVRSGTRLVPKVAPIVLPPESAWGKAPMFTADKRIAGLWIPTQAFDAIVLWLGTVLLYAALWISRRKMRTKRR